MKIQSHFIIIILLALPHQAYSKSIDWKQLLQFVLQFRTQQTDSKNPTQPVTTPVSLNPIDPQFNEKCYLERYPDVQKNWVEQGKNAYVHYLKYGKKEGRIASCDQVPNGAKDNSDQVFVRINGDLFAGAVESIYWNNKEFLNIHDHGRQLQSALVVDHFGECNNPTEAGSSHDRNTSTSKLLHFTENENVIEAQTQMAYWSFNKKTGACTKGLDSRLKSPLSNHILNKKISKNVLNDPKILKFDLEFLSPMSDVQSFIQYEILTGYLTTEFDRFYFLKNSRFMEYNKFTDIGAQAGFPNQTLVAHAGSASIAATSSGSHAMGYYLPPSQLLGCKGVSHGYGVNKFNLGGNHATSPGTNKWNMAFGEDLQSKCIKKENGYYKRQFQVYLVIGSLPEVSSKLLGLTQKLK